MRILVLSDIHLEVAPFEPAASSADVVVLAGDIANGGAGVDWAERSFRAPVLYVPGNHEYYDHEFDQANESLRNAVGARVRLLDCNEAITDDVRFLGCTLWTDYTLVPDTARAAVVEEARAKNPDYAKIRFDGRSFTPEHAMALCRKHRAWLERKLYEPFGGRTVVITHFAPHPKSIAPAYTGHPANPGFVLDLSPLMGRAALWIHGHTHTAFDYEVKGTRVVCNPRGYPGEPTGFRADLTLDL
ncbi:MAG TPA: metallophosphoesterase [Burkholderiales bacterium]|jgi:predicted phosphodiesterase|nr:metallophosphoesterase [Burkholderiales bacterium]